MLFLFLLCFVSNIWKIILNEEFSVSFLFSFSVNKKKKKEKDTRTISNFPYSRTRSLFIYLLYFLVMVMVDLRLCFSEFLKEKNILSVSLFYSIYIYIYIVYVSVYSFMRFDLTGVFVLVVCTQL